MFFWDARWEFVSLSFMEESWGETGVMRDAYTAA